MHFLTSGIIVTSILISSLPHKALTIELPLEKKSYLSFEIRALPTLTFSTDLLPSLFQILGMSSVGSYSSMQNINSSTYTSKCTPDGDYLCLIQVKVENGIFVSIVSTLNGDYNGH